MLPQKTRIVGKKHLQNWDDVKKRLQLVKNAYKTGMMYKNAYCWLKVVNTIILTKHFL